MVDYYRHSIEWKTHRNTYTRDGVTWNTWLSWCLTFKRCKPGYECFYYDGNIRTFRFGFFVICTMWDSDYREQHEKAKEHYETE